MQLGLSFTGTFYSCLLYTSVVDVLRFWAAEYHVDGIHIVGYAPLETIVKDPYLADLKIWAKNWDEVRLEKGTNRSSRSKEEKKDVYKRQRSYRPLPTVSWRSLTAS